MKHKDITTHEVAKIISILAKCGKQLEQLEDIPISKLIDIAENINNKNNSSEDTKKENNKKKLAAILPIDDNNPYTKRKEAISFENNIKDLLQKMSQDEMIKYAKENYNHTLPKVGNYESNVDELIDVALLKHGYDLKHRTNPFLTETTREQAFKVLSDRHKFPNKFAYIRLGKKIGLELDESLSKEAMINKILDVKYSELSKFYKSFKKV